MLTSPLNITVNQDSPVAVRDQLVEQIGLKIASGLLKGNESLPSIRAMAQKLKIHQSVVHSAYNQLSEIGMISIRHGSGVQVVPGIGLDQKGCHSTLQAMFMQFASRAASAGYCRETVKDFCRQFFQRQPVNKIVVVDRNPDFHPVIRAELEPHFAMPVHTITEEQLRQDQSQYTDALIITSLYHFTSIQPLLADPTRFLICNVNPAQDLIDLLKSVPDSSIVLFVSVSPTLLKMGQALAAAARGESIIVKCHTIDETGEIAYMTRYAKAIVCDRPSQARVLSLAKNIPVHIFALYCPETIQLIKDRLEKWG